MVNEQTDGLALMLEMIRKHDNDLPAVMIDYLRGLDPIMAEGDAAMLAGAYFGAADYVLAKIDQTKDQTTRAGILLTMIFPMGVYLGMTLAAANIPTAEAVPAAIDTNSQAEEKATLDDYLSLNEYFRPDGTADLIISECIDGKHAIPSIIPRGDKRDIFMGDLKEAERRIDPRPGAWTRRAVMVKRIGCEVTAKAA